MEEVFDDTRIEEEIDLELSKISLSSSESDDPDSSLSAKTSSDNEAISDELPEPVLHYLNFVTSRSKNAEWLLLQDLESDEILNDICRVTPNNASECLAELASAYNEDPEELKKRVLSEIEDEEQLMSTTSDNASETNNNGDGDTVVSFTFHKVEERCKQEYELWVEKQNELEHERIKQLKALRDTEEAQSEEEERKRQLRWKELETEQLKLEMFHARQQAEIEAEVLKVEEVWDKQLRQHKEMMENLHMQIEEEKRAFEKQQALRKKQLTEQWNSAAVKIQAKFRAYIVYKKYAPLLRERRLALEMKRELQEKMKREMKEKLEQLEKRAQEREKEEKERKSHEEKERQKHAEKVERYEEYEKKKEIMRLQREQLILEEMKREEQSKVKTKIEKHAEPEYTSKDNMQWSEKQQETEEVLEEKNEKMPRRLEFENRDEYTEIEREEKALKIGKGQKATKIQKQSGPMKTERPLAIAKNKVVINEIKEQKEEKDEEMRLIGDKEEKKQTQEIRHEEQKQGEKHEMMCEERYVDRGNENRNLKSGKEKYFNSEKVPGNDVKDHCREFVELKKSCNGSAFSNKTVATDKQEKSMHSSCIGKDVQLELADSDQIDRVDASENTNTKPNLKEIHTEVTSQGENLVSFFEQSVTIPESIEKKRLTWMKTCKSWSRVHGEHQRKKTAEKSRPRKCSASLMPPLSATVILQAGPWTALQQVTTITFQDLPGCSLSTLSQCLKLQFLSLRRCGLLALEGIENCKDLKYINVEENNIQTVNCENLENLCILILNKNNIPSIHGLVGCKNLWNLELSYNKITRIGGLESVKNLQRLVVSHNQLISTKGLCDAPTLVYIDCSFNHLTHIEGIENCGLLQILKLQGNNLSEFPSLENHVLLRELYLDDNSISTLEELSVYWLPLLRILFLSQNSLTRLAPLFSCVSLEKLDISNNCLLDLKSFVQWLNGCENLRELYLHGNPLLQEENWRYALLKILPCLKILNDENVSSTEEIIGENINKKTEPGSFAVFCQAQIQEIDSVSKKATAELIDEHATDAMELQCWYLKKLMTLSVEHRYAHEYGLLNTAKEERSEKQTCALNRPITEVKEDNLDSFNVPKGWIAPGYAQTVSVNSFTIEPRMENNEEFSKKKKILQFSINHSKESKDDNALISPRKRKLNKQITASNGGNYVQHFESSQNLAATVIQSYWRGYRVRKKINLYVRLHLAATIIQSSWRNYCTRKKAVSFKQDCHLFMDKHKAATVIQALWKGFRLRKKLASALAAVKTDEVEDDYREVNVDDFVYDEVVMEKEWPDLDFTRFLSQTKLFSDQLPSPKHNEHTRCEDKSHYLKWLPDKTWNINERPKSYSSEDNQIISSEKSTFSQPASLKSQKSCLKLQKEEKISEEWGFKDISTAQLMLKRAHKMKAKKTSPKNLDPAVRLALFKNNENKHPPVKPPKKSQTAKASYFEVVKPNQNPEISLIQGKVEEFAHTEVSSTSKEKMERTRERTYQWLNTQVWDYEGASPRNEKCKHFLPEIDPDVLKGGRVQLVTSPVRREDTDLELVSMTSGSALTQNKEKSNQPHRPSARSSKKDAPAPERSHLGPLHKERISFRDHPVHFSGGWGSGKRKAKPLK